MSSARLSFSLLVVARVSERVVSLLFLPLCQVLARCFFSGRREKVPRLGGRQHPTRKEGFKRGRGEVELISQPARTSSRLPAIRKRGGFVYFILISV